MRCLNVPHSEESLSFFMLRHLTYIIKPFLYNFLKRPKFSYVTIQLKNDSLCFYILGIKTVISF